MPVLYDTATGLYTLGIRAAALFHAKAKRWVSGREGLWERLERKKDALQGCLWMHCASVGEFEQGLPVLEAIKQERPELPVLVTFFSPSGYEARKDIALATHVEYLPSDNAANARRLVSLLRPKAVLWVKYEFWHHHLHALKAAKVPVFLVSAIFRPDQPFFRWYGGAWRSMLGCFAHVFVQDNASQTLLKGVGITAVSVSGDTRFDRVHDIASTPVDLPIADAFRGSDGAAILVAGSTWPADEALLAQAFDSLRDKPRVIIAPHELSTDSLTGAESRSQAPVLLWSTLEKSLSNTEAPARTLLVDRMGLLSRLYRYGDIAYVGGGFGDGIHSLLEAAVWGRPVIFGPKHHKFAEAQGLIDAGGGFVVNNADELAPLLNTLLGDQQTRKEAGERARRFVQEHVGATALVADTVLREL